MEKRKPLKSASNKSSTKKQKKSTCYIEMVNIDNMLSSIEFYKKPGHRKHAQKVHLNELKMNGNEQNIRARHDRDSRKKITATEQNYFQYYFMQV